jgi:hypothetical protein
MLTFNPPEILKKLQHAKLVLAEFVHWQWYQIDDKSFDPNCYEDEIISFDSLIPVFLAHTFVSFPISVREVLNLADDFESAVLIKASIAISKHNAAIYLSPDSDSAIALVNGFPVNLRELPIILNTNFNGNEYRLSLTNEVNIFNVLIERQYSKSFDKYNHSYYEEMAFILISYDNTPDVETLEKLAMSFLFSLATSYGLLFSFASFGIALDHFADELDEEVITEGESGIKTVRLRPVDTSLGMDALYKLYMDASTASRSGDKIVSFAKVLEFCAESFLRQKIHVEVDNLLRMPGALNPNAEYIDKIIGVISDQKDFKKQDNSFQMLLRECCNALELCEHAPACLNTLKNVIRNSKDEDKRKALDQLSQCIVATRNQLVHAKPGYKTTGQECPESEIDQLAACMEKVALQAIIWFSRLPEQFRVIK